MHHRALLSLLLGLAASLAAGCQDYAALYAAAPAGDGGADQTDGDGSAPEGDTPPADGDPSPGDGDAGTDADAGGDDLPECPYIGGTFHVLNSCFPDTLGEDHVFQEFCTFGSWSLGEGIPMPECGGEVHPDGTLRYECSIEDLHRTCTGRIHEEGLPFGLTCDDGCQFAFYPIQGECTSRADCREWEACRIFQDADELLLVTDCYSVIPGVPNAGTRCQADEDCFSGWCLDRGFCAGLCMLDTDCPQIQTGRACVDDVDCPGQSPCDGGFCAVPGTCQTVGVDLGPGPDGQTVLDWARMCLPESRPCEADADCPAQQVCRQRFAPTTWEGYELLCGPP